MRDRSLFSSFALLGLLAAFSAAGCLEGDVDSMPDEESEELGEADQAMSKAEKRGKKLFKKETFDGNDRTCETCHSGKDGTLSPEEVEKAFQRDPEGPLFRSIDSDDGEGDAYTRLRENATVRVVVELPPNLRPLDDLTATHVVLNRAIPTTNNVALDPVLMVDGRQPDLESQALGAIHDHAENGRAPTDAELSDIAAFEETLYSSNKLKKFANGGPAPTLPEGRTASERRGRTWFLPDQVCGSCHSGPMLNETSEFHASGPGHRFDFVLAGELLSQPNPLREWAVIDPETGDFLFDFGFPFPDPGRMIATGNPAEATAFKIPTLWGVKDTAPYFHDNSARDLEELMAHYTLFFQMFGPVDFTPQDEADIIAFLKLL